MGAVLDGKKSNPFGLPWWGRWGLVGPKNCNAKKAQIPASQCAWRSAPKKQCKQTGNIANAEKQNPSPGIQSPATCQMPRYQRQQRFGLPGGSNNATNRQQPTPGLLQQHSPGRHVRPAHEAEPPGGILPGGRQRRRRRRIPSRGVPESSSRMVTARRDHPNKPTGLLFGLTAERKGGLKIGGHSF